MDIAKHEALFSPARLRKYINACGGDYHKAKLLYKYNIQASQALYPMISVLEIALRNGIDRELSKHFSDPNWLINKRNAFANHPDMVYKDSRGRPQPDHFFSDKLRRAEDKLRFRGVPVSHGKLLAELTFGFWVKFFDSNAIKILGGAPLNAFVNKPRMKLTLVHSHLNSLVTLRNRISHSEPICFDRTGAVCLLTLARYQSDITDGLNWLDADLNHWAGKMNFFPPVYNRIKSLLEPELAPS
jgi:Abi-like protein